MSAGGDRVLVLAWIVAEGGASRVPIEVETTHVVTVGDGRITSTRAYRDCVEAPEAVGLREHPMSDEHLDTLRTGLAGWEPVPADELERAREVFAAWSGGDIEPMLEVWAADCEVHSTVAGVAEGQGGVFRGHEGIRAYSRELAEALGHLVFELAEMRRRGRLTLMIGHTAGRGRASGVELDVPIFWLSEQNDEGKNIWAQAFGDLDEALVVAARREPSD